MTINAINLSTTFPKEVERSVLFEKGILDMFLDARYHNNHHRTNKAGIYCMKFKVKDDNNKPAIHVFSHACSDKIVLPIVLTLIMAQEVYRKKLRASPRNPKQI